MGSKYQRHVESVSKVSFPAVSTQSDEILSLTVKVLANIHEFVEQPKVCMSWHFLFGDSFSCCYVPPTQRIIFWLRWICLHFLVLIYSKQNRFFPKGQVAPKWQSAQWSFPLSSLPVSLSLLSRHNTPSNPQYGRQCCNCFTYFMYVKFCFADFFPRLNVASKQCLHHGGRHVGVLNFQQRFYPEHS